ncbi:ssDNA endonuclease and repair protein rad10 [Entomortierella lignicola]|nr:ssDNA endonuclease and repair protein rad10 [Entomortierella lignicola]
MDAGPSKGNTNGGANPTRTFKLPTRQEAEERRKQLEANKPELLFKPKGIGEGQSTISATNSVKTSVPPISQRNNTQAAIISSNNTVAPTPSIVSSRQYLQQKQQEQSESLEDDFGFDDDFGDVILDDDIFDIDDSSSKAQKPTNLPNQKNTPASSSSSPVAATASSTVDPTTVPVTPQFVAKSKSTVVVKASQRGNPLLQFIRNVPYEYGDILPDFIVGLTSCVLFLSIRYHRLHPEYIFNRIAALGKTFVLRVLLVLVDVDTHQQAIRELTRVAMINDFTIVCAWSNEEAARYIETYKAYENKAPDAIKERVDNDYLSKLTDCLTQIQTVNKTDVVTLSSTFGSFTNIMNASVDELGILPGFGERKVRRLLEAFDQPFAIDPKKRKHRRQ